MGRGQSGLLRNARAWRVDDNTDARAQKCESEDPERFAKKYGSLQCMQKKRCVDTQHSTPRKKDVERKMELIRSIDFLKLQMKTNTSSKVSSQSKYLAHIKIQISTKPQDIRKIIKN